MREAHHLDAWCHALLSLTLLVTNVLAPFRMSSRGRAFLEGLPHNVADHSVIRVRAVTPVATSLGHRAVVGLARGGTDADEPEARSDNNALGFLPFPTDAFPGRPLACSGMRPTPPLRC